MKILFLTEYFFPFIHGGAELSVQLLGKKLVEKGNRVTLLAPNYGAPPRERVSGIEVIRYPFGVILKDKKAALTPSWFFNPFFCAYQLLVFLFYAKKNGAQIIHIQGQYSIIAGVLAARILRLPSIITFRDNQILCNYGYCLTNNQPGKTCSLLDYFFKDFVQYYQDKVSSKNPGVFLIQLILACMGRFRTYCLKFFAQAATANICSSMAQARTFSVNGFAKVKAIYNIYEPPKQITKTKPQKYLLYATKVSTGKGLGVLLEAMSLLPTDLKDIKLLVAGRGEIEKFRRQARELKIEDRVDFLGEIDSDAYKTLRQKALLEIAPSLYPESFGRAALEAIANGTPVIASNRGGLAEIVEDEVTGLVVEPSGDKIAEAISKGIKENRQLRATIRKSWDALQVKFKIKPVTEYIDLYKALL